MRKITLDELIVGGNPPATLKKIQQVFGLARLNKEKLLVVVGKKDFHHGNPHLGYIRGSKRIADIADFILWKEAGEVKILKDKNGELADYIKGYDLDELLKGMTPENIHEEIKL